MVKDDGLPVLDERINTMGADENEIYKFLGVEHADGIKMKEVYNRVNEEISKRMNIITKTKLNNNGKVIPVAA